MTSVLQHWNKLPAAEAEAAILPANGSRAWASALTAGRPYGSPADLLRAATRTWSALPPEDWQDAFSTHPRIGERHAPAASAQSLAWSAAEQSTAEQATAEQSSTEKSTATAQAEAQTESLRVANLAYEARFGRTFLIRAAGRTRPEILDALYARLSHSPAEELLEAAEQQREITHLRLERWLGGA